ncbi:MAG: hypothetical protein FD122_3775, partial [Stygiobacter sp.]
MFKKFVTKLKTLFGAKSKVVPAPSARLTKETKQTPHQHKKYPDKKSSGTHHPRDSRKRETREEYRLRHEKQDREREPEVESSLPAKRIIPAEPWDSSVFKVPVV